MLRSIRGFLALLLLLLGLSVVAFPGEAFACPCVDFGVKDSVKAYDTVVRGTVFGDDSIPGDYMETVNFDVDAVEVYKGSLAPGLITVSSAGSSAACGWENGEGQDDLILFLEEVSPGAYTTNLCAGNQLYSEKLEAQVVKAMGKDAGGEPLDTTTETPPPADEGLGSDQILIILIMGGGAFLLIFGIIKAFRNRNH